MLDTEDISEPEAPYPITPRRVSNEEIEEAQHFVETVARIDRRGLAFHHLCVLLSDATFHRSLGP